jgi:NAD(P)H-hydrate epimerase
MKLVSVAEMKAIERQADENGLTYSQMMQNAGTALAAEIKRRYTGEGFRIAVGLVGSGNNGGDCLVALTDLQRAGWDSTAILVRDRADDDPLVTRFRQVGGMLQRWQEITREEMREFYVQRANVLIDGVLGTGIQLPLKPELAQVMGEIKQLVESAEPKMTVVAVDCPSGVDCDSGAAADETIPADLTLCMAAAKDGLLLSPAFEMAGEMTTVDIGLPADLPAWQAVQREVADVDRVRAILPERKPDSHKGTYGTALIVAGSVNYSGAVLLAGEAAYRIGAGLVTLAVVAPLHAALASALPEATWLLLPHEMGVISAGAVDLVRKQLDKVDAMLLGPGWGMEETTQNFLERLIQAKPAAPKPGVGFIQNSTHPAEDGPQLPALVIDADGLKLLSKIEGWAKLVPTGTILTPHPGEMAILTGMKIGEVQADRYATAVKFAREWDKVVVLKGAFTIVADASGRTAVIPVATSALAKGGTGDVLAGMITGLRAQGVPPFEAAVAGAWMHAHAGLAAADQWGSEAMVLAGDVILGLSEVFEILKQ